MQSDGRQRPAIRVYLLWILYRSFWMETNRLVQLVACPVPLRQ